MFLHVTLSVEVCPKVIATSEFTSPRPSRIFSAPRIQVPNTSIQPLLISSLQANTKTIYSIYTFLGTEPSVAPATSSSTFAHSGVQT